MALLQILSLRDFPLTWLLQIVHNPTWLLNPKSVGLFSKEQPLKYQQATGTEYQGANKVKCKEQQLWKLESIHHV